jgi:hypothetical protein
MAHCRLTEGMLAILYCRIHTQQASRHVSPPSPLAPQRQYISPCARGLRQRRGNKIGIMPLRPSMSWKVICQPGEFAVLQKCNKEHSFNLMGAKCILPVCSSNDCLSRVMELKVWRHPQIWAMTVCTLHHAECPCWQHYITTRWIDTIDHTITEIQRWAPQVVFFEIIL